MNIQDAESRLNKPPMPGIRWDARDREAAIAACAGLATLRQKLAEAEKERDVAARERNKLFDQLHVESVEHFNESAAVNGRLHEARAALATAEVDCATMREALENLTDAQCQCDEPMHPIWCMAHQTKYCEMNALVAKARAALTRPTGQAIMDELESLRKQLNIARGK